MDDGMIEPFVVFRREEGLRKFRSSVFPSPRATLSQEYYDHCLLPEIRRFEGLVHLDITDISNL